MWRELTVRGSHAPVRMGVLGRDAELGLIGAWLRHDEADGPGAAGAVLAIEGVPGIGKTTLWTEAVRQARGAGWRVLSCRPAPSDAGCGGRRAGAVLASC